MSEGSPGKWFSGCILCHVNISFDLCCLLGFRLDELRHRLIPLYSYDPAEDEGEWEASGGRGEEEEEELAVSRPQKIKLSR